MFNSFVVFLSPHSSCSQTKTKKNLNQLRWTGVTPEVRHILQRVSTHLA